MKRILLLPLITVATMVSCNNHNDQSPHSVEILSEKEPELNIEIDTVAEIDTIAELKAIKQSGTALYNWLLENNNGIINVSIGENGYCSLDTLAYFSGLRKIGTISKKFIDFEKARVNDCAGFISTIKYTDYMNSEMYDFDEQCQLLYDLYWVRDQIGIIGFSIRNSKLTTATQATMDVYIKYDDGEEPSSQLLLEKENNIWKITAVNFIKK